MVKKVKAVDKATVVVKIAEMEIQAAKVVIALITVIPVAIVPVIAREEEEDSRVNQAKIFGSAKLTKISHYSTG